MDTRTSQQKENGVIIVRLQGGLGNQLFQYALGKHLSIIHKKTLKLDISNYTTAKSDPQKDERRYCLKHLNIKAQITEPEDTAPFQKYFKNKFFSKRLIYIIDFGKYFKYSYIFEPPNNFFIFDAHLLTKSFQKIVYLDGYWQTEKYFTSIEHIIRKDFIFKEVPDKVNKKILTEIDSSHAVCIHVRRGDYAIKNSPKHRVLSLSYYHKAAVDLAQTVKNPCFYVFSDEPEWAKNNLQLNFPLTFISHNGDNKNYEDLRLMIHCKHHIIANSTFSWWGAWLGKKSGQLVYAPKRYFIHKDIPTFDFYPASWKLIDI
jgi:hypothetical protein